MLLEVFSRYSEMETGSRVEYDVEDVDMSTIKGKNILYRSLGNLWVVDRESVGVPIIGDYDQEPYVKEHRETMKKLQLCLSSDILPGTTSWENVKYDKPTRLRSE